MNDFVDLAKAYAFEYGLALLGALVTLVVGLWIAKLISRGAERLTRRSNVDPTLAGFVRNLTYFALLTLVVISALGVLGVNTTSFVAVVGAAGLAIGLAFQDSLGNLASGIMLIVLRPFRAGDYVEVAGTSGAVQEVQIFATTLVTPDNKEVTIPNGEITSAVIINYSAKPTRRIDLVIGVSYEDDLRRTKEILQEVVAAEPRVLPEPEPVIAVSELADSSVNLVVRPWVITADYWPVRFDLIEAIKTRLDAEGITIPFPQRDVHLHGGDEAAPRAANTSAA